MHGAADGQRNYMMLLDLTALYNQVLDRQDRLIIRLLTNVGIAPSEIPLIHIEDINLSEKRELHVRDFREPLKIHRTVELDSETCLDLNDYLITKGKHLGHDKGYLFAITPRTIQRLCVGYGRKARLPQKVTPSLLINTFTKNAVKSSKSPQWICNQRGLRTIKALYKFIEIGH